MAVIDLILVAIFGFVILPLTLKYLVPLIPILVVIGAIIAIFGIFPFLFPFVAGILALCIFCLQIQKRRGGGGD